MISVPSKHIIILSRTGIVMCLPVWLFPYFPTVDGAAHLEIATYMKRLLLGACETDKYFEFTKAIVPNLSTHIILMLLASIFPPIIAEKILISAYIILMNYALFKCVKFNNKKSLAYLIIIPVITTNYFFYGGGYNFIFSIAIYLLAFLWWLKNYTNLKLPILFLWVIGLYLTHFFGLACFGISIGAHILYLLLKRKPIISLITKTALAFAPVALLFLHYYLLPKSEIAGGFDNLYNKLSYLFFPMFFSAFSPEYGFQIMTIYAATFWVGLLFFVYYRIRTKLDLIPSDIFFIAGLLFALCIIITPQSFGGGWLIERRFSLIFYTLMFIWLLNQKYHPILLNSLIIISVMLIGYLTIRNADYVAKYNNLLTEQQNAAKYIDANSLILGIDLSPQVLDYKTGKIIFRIPSPNITHFIATEKCISTAYSFHIGEPNVFVINYIEGSNPHQSLGKFRNLKAQHYIPPIINFDGYKKATGNKIDYVVISGNEKFLKDETRDGGIYSRIAWQELMSQVNASYKLVYVSPNDIVRVYKHKN